VKSELASGRVEASAAGRRKRLSALALVPIAVFVCWQLADLEGWAEDEAGNLWLASEMLSGRFHTLGLVSSTGIRNMIGAPLLALPFAGLADLLSVSRALAIVHLAVLAVLALWIGRTPAERTFALGALWFNPALVLTSFSLWNQYLARLIGVMLVVLLVLLAESRAGARTRALVVVAYVGLAWFQPAVHLLHLADLAVYLFLLGVVLASRSSPLDRQTLLLGLLVVSLLALVLYVPWVLDSIERFRAYRARRVLLPGALSVMAVGTVSYSVGFRRLLGLGETAFARKPLRWLLVPLPTAGLLIGLFVALHGAQAGRRLVGAGGSAGIALLVVQALTAIVLAPALWWGFPRRGELSRPASFLRRAYGDRTVSAAIVLLLAGLLISVRLVVGVTPWKRSDLWIAVTPALLTPALLLAQTRRWSARRLAVFAPSVPVAALAWLALFGPGDAYRQAYPRVVAASEMQAAIDWVAARHHSEGGGVEIDLGYPLTKDKEWIPRRVTWHPDFRWYSIGRPYDWLLRRRHGLANAHEGKIDRTGGRAFQIAYRAEPPASEDWYTLHELDRLLILRRR
jgi:hypothetical protein